MDRPVITDYQEPRAFMEAMLKYRKASEASFSVHRICKSLRRVSPALVSLVVAGKRRISIDRCEEFARLLGLNTQEKVYFRDWLMRLDDASDTPRPEMVDTHRKSASSHLLQDWLNVYVKDAFKLTKIQQNPKLIYQLLGGIASTSRIDRSINFLLSNGYLRRNTAGNIIEDTPLHIVDQRIPDGKVQQFHRATLANAAKALAAFPTDQRFANALVVALDERAYSDLVAIVESVSERLQQFAEQQSSGERLYQLVINLSPTGGRL
jgi:uncharacterized protein (TIGR02147 family)